jgi:hypothetical protein
MKRIKTFVLAASFLTLTLGAFPHHASASVNAFLYVDGDGDEESYQWILDIIESIPQV